MSTSPVIMRGIGKRYQIGSKIEPYGRLSESVSRAFRPSVGRMKDQTTARAKSKPSKYLWALREVTLEVEEGEVLGIIGRNGAGKTTLLKILSRITEPTEGYAELRGRVGSLLEVGTGFHPELTGRENIYLNGAILGMPRKNIDRRFDEIVAFAEVEDFLDIPVKRYSSGMHVRLAFAVSAHLEPDILIIDEILAVGDAAFQRKCLGRMSDAAKSGRTVLFVSHNIAAVAALCSRGIVIEQGRIVEDAPIEAAISRYQSKALQGNVPQKHTFRERTGSGSVKFNTVEIRGEGSATLTPGSPIRIDMTFETEQSIRGSSLAVGIGINGSWGERLCTLLSRFDPDFAGEGKIDNATVVSCLVSRLLLRPGTYTLSLYVDVAGEVADRLVDALELVVDEGDFFGSGNMPSSSQGPLLLDQKWICARIS